MAVKIRMKSLGRKNRPFFRVCAMDSRSPRNGRVIEELGHYDPMVSETDARAILDGERIDYWLSVGATPSPKVSVLIRKYGSNGSHVDKQKSALERLANRRGVSIESARRAAIEAAKSAPVKKVEAPAPAETAPEEGAAEGGPAEE